MSDTESFKSVYERLYPQLHNPCGLWKAATIAEWLDDLERAHNREIRDTAQQEYHRGFEDGRHSMDAEHRAIAMRLRALRFDGGSHENLARIAYAIYPCATGWTCESAAGLRDKLVDLMGGVSDDTSIGAGGGACAGCDGRDSGEQEEIGDDCVDCDILGPDSRGHAVGRDFHELGVSDGRVADDCGVDTGCGSSGCDLHMAGVTYDVLDNERRKAVCELRGISIDTLCDTYDYIDVYPEFIWAVGQAIGLRHGAGFEEIIKRLIHLLGGDRPSGIDLLRAMDAESDTDGTSPNDDPTPSITDELRKWASDRHCKGISHTDALNIGLIADRIDEQFDRICQQQEAVLQSTIDGIVKEYEHDRLPDQLRIEKLEKQRDHWRQQATDMMNHADAMEHERDNLLDLLRDAVVDFEYASYSWNYATIVGENITIETERNRLAKERDELQAKLDKANGENKGLRLSIDEQKESIAQRKKTIKKLTRDNEKVWKTVHELQAKLDAIRDALDG